LVAWPWERCAGSRSACRGGVAGVAVVIARGDGFNLRLAHSSVNRDCARVMESLVQFVGDPQRESLRLRPNNGRAQEHARIISVRSDMEAVTTADTVEEARWTPRAIMPRAHATEGTAIAIGNPRDIATLTSGREQPSGPASGQDRPKNRGVAHAPATSVTPA
jgi:hypothetical protein